MKTYLVVTIKSWNIENFFKYTKNFKGEWHLISDNEDFTLVNIENIKPDKIFFIHWSWLIPKEIFDKYECILFHMTDLPFGRGGSPLQNLIVREIYNTKISAFRVVKDLDAGDIYLKKPLNIEYGTAKEIFKKASDTIYQMIDEILSKNLKPIPQKGKVVKFMRRTPEEGDLKDLSRLKEIYDYIRMLDAEGYPKAFIQLNNIRYEFYHPILKDNELNANVIIKKEDSSNDEK
jgi:methionyl-tRNA formyltransferase